MPRMFQFPYGRYPYPYSYYPRRNVSFQPSGNSNKKQDSSKESCSSYKNERDSNTSQNCTSDATSKESRNTVFPNNLLSFLPTSIGPLTFNPSGFTDQEEPIFEFFGIKLYLDDIIILGILFFLYEEKVEDQMLYVSLILLLLS